MVDFDSIFKKMIYFLPAAWKLKKTINFLQYTAH